MTPVRLKHVVLGEGRTKVIVPVTGRTVDELLGQAAALAGHDPDVVEWRADFFDGVGRVDEVVSAGRRLVVALEGRPLLFTVRTQAEGGDRAIATDDYVALNLAVVEAGLADAVDVEHAVDREAGDAVLAAAHAHGVPVVGSWHDFSATPPADDMVARLVAMQARGFDIAKAAVMPRDPGDVLELMRATWTMASRHPRTPVITMSMDALGLVTRLAAPVFGSCATFAAVGRASAPGQVPVGELRPALALLERGRPAVPGALRSSGVTTIALIGLSGSGKSTIGPLLARRLGLPHRDVDRDLEQREGRSIADIFASDGEARFRALERDLTLTLLGEPGVLSLGGGAPMTPEIGAALRSHAVVWLRVAPESAARRVGTDPGRPLLGVPDVVGRLRRMLAERGPTYAGLASLVVDTDVADPDAVVDAIAAHVSAGARS